MDDSVFYRLFHCLSDYYILPKVYAQKMLARILRTLCLQKNRPALKETDDDSERGDSS